MHGPDPQHTERLVIVGNGMAGARVLEEILTRGGGERFDITVFGDEPHGNYNRISLSNVLAGSEQAADIFLNPLDWYAENGVALQAGLRVTGIDRFGRTVEAEDGRLWEYDKLIIATGSVPFLPPVAGVAGAGGAPKPGVFTFRTMADCDRMLAWGAEAAKVVVVGGGLLGLEAARGLQARGLDAEVVHRSTHLMNLQLDPEAGAILKDAVEELGIPVHLEMNLVAVLGDEGVRGVRFDDGSEIACEMVVFATGIRPNVALAAQDGFEVERGIVVDDAMRVVDNDDVFALGECVQHRGQTYGLVAPLWDQAVVLADRLCGTDPHAEYHGSKIVTKLKVSGVDVATMGVIAPERRGDELIRFAEPSRGVYKSVVVRDGVLIGATLLGDVMKVSTLTQAFDKGSALPERRVELLFDLGAEGGAGGVTELDDDAQICNCNGVCKGDIVGAVRGGLSTMKAVAEKTRAGTGCGSCKTDVLALVEWAADGALEVDPTDSYYVACIAMAKPELMTAVREQELQSVSAVFAAFSDGTEDAKAKPALSSLLRLVWGADFVEEKDARFINDRVHGNIQKDGTFSVVPRISGGVTSPQQLRRIADVADKHQIPMVKVTGGQRIDLLGVPKEKLPEVWKDLDMPSGYAYGKSFRTVKTCVGTDFCRFGLGDSTALGIAIEERFKGLESPAKLKLAVAGCPRNCSEAMVKDVGFVAVEGGRWEMYVGGAAGASVRKGDLLCTLDSPAEAMTMCGRFIQHYRENARWLERTYGYMERVGADEVRAVVVEDRDGDAERLDAAIQRSVDAYRDPWLEGQEPTTVNQFASVVGA